ncbi:PIR protein [Plasmodium yoelii]|uniref:PIR protein n=2 Tax=Plasmodium yoelii TaxID=5861 RepID=A0AAE9WT55_PLAYO|nr:PIR protein [Plasmodium yoelii]WBY59606.1 PIR protein [Plasmodium yoelii yoelii]VTZ80348.1 PIR protein [Plasmodium yoelii]|eukprot:XP_022810983.2 PIR protein [Plasmodium yoelii]
MDKNLCKKFQDVRKWFPDSLSNGKYLFKEDKHFNKYCNNNNCDGPFDKISAGCLYFFNEFFGSSEMLSQYASNYINVVDYIMVWLIHMLSLTENEHKNSLNHFYTTFINSDEKYKTSIKNVEDCSNYKDLILKKHNLTNKDMDNNIISKLYGAFNILCEMYTGFDINDSYCTKCSEKAKQFVEKYNELNTYHSITENSSGIQILCTLSNDYNNFKKKCNDSPSIPTIDKTKITIKCPEQISGVISSNSSVANKLFIFLSIFSTIAIFLGISYKYSLFGFRKRFKKQQIREKIKNIKKKMNQ